MDSPDYSLLGSLDQSYDANALKSIDASTLKWADATAEQTATGGVADWLMNNAKSGISPQDAVAASVLQKQSDDLTQQMTALMQERAKAIADLGKNLDDSEYQKLLGMVRDQMAGRQPMPEKQPMRKLKTAEQVFAALGALLDPKHAADNVASVVGGVQNENDRLYQESVANWQAGERARNQNISDLTELAGYENQRLNKTLDRETRNIEANYSTRYDTLQVEKATVDKQMAKERQTEVTKLTNDITNSKQHDHQERVKLYNTLMAKYPDVAQHYSPPERTADDDMRDTQLASKEFDRQLKEMEVANKPTEIAQKNKKREIDIAIGKWTLKMKPDMAKTVHTIMKQKEWDYAHSEERLEIRKRLADAQVYNIKAWPDKIAFNKFLSSQSDELSTLRTQYDAIDQEYNTYNDYAYAISQEMKTGNYSPDTIERAKKDGYSNPAKWANERLVVRLKRLKKDKEDLEKEIKQMEKNVPDLFHPVIPNTSGLQRIGNSVGPNGESEMNNKTANFKNMK